MSGRQEQRAERLAAALRANLKRRKAQARDAASAADDKRADEESGAGGPAGEAGTGGEEPEHRCTD